MVGNKIGCGPNNIGTVIIIMIIMIIIISGERIVSITPFSKSTSNGETTSERIPKPSSL